jgi:D-amino-acid oxidase
MQDRRNFLKVAGVLGAGVLTGLSAACSSPKFSQRYLDRNFIASDRFKKFPKLQISMDRIIKETVGLRPFRKNGFRVEKEELGTKTIIHNYGHGGSGWSLSWGTASLAVALADTTGEKSFAVMGCGVVGLTTARLLQNHGYSVTIYAKDLPPNITSSRATGTWSPSYTLIEQEFLTPEFEERWRQAAMYSFKTYQNLMGLNDIVTWTDEYSLRSGQRDARNREGGYANLRLEGLLPGRLTLGSKEHPFQAEQVSKQTTLVFNIPSYLNKHIQDFLAFGGKIVIKTFNSLEDVDALSEKCIVNCTGLGSKALFNDENMMPVAGQLSVLIPQPEFNYRLTTDNGYAIPRKDGIILGGNSIKGSWDESPSKEQTEKVVHALMEVMNNLRA